MSVRFPRRGRNGDEDHREATTRNLFRRAFRWWFNATVCRCAKLWSAITRLERLCPTMGENRGPRRGAVHFDGADHPAPVAAAAAVAARLSQWDTYHPYPATSCHGVPRTEAIVSIITICSHQRGQAWPDCQTGVSQKNRRNRDSRQATTISVSIDGNRPFDAHDAFLIPRMLRAFKAFRAVWNFVLKPRVFVRSYSIETKSTLITFRSKISFDYIYKHIIEFRFTS